MGNTGSTDDPFLLNINLSFTRLINQLNRFLDTVPPPGPISAFIVNLNSKFIALQTEIDELQNSEPSSVNLASINNSISSLNTLMQTTRNDIISLQNQAVDIMTLQDIQATLTNLSNDLIALQASVGSVNVVNLSALATSLNSQVTSMLATLNSKVDKSTSINGKQLNTNINITKADIGLSLVTNDQQLKRTANDYRSFSERTVISSNDVLLFEDSEVGGSKYCASVSALPASDSVTTALNNKVAKLALSPTVVGGSNKSVTMTVNGDGQVTSVVDGLINITPAQANLGNVVNSDTTNIANSFIRNNFLPINSIVAVNDSGLNALQKLQGQLNSRLISMIGATSVANGVTGLVPAPLLGQNSSFLRGDGTWAANTMAVSAISAAINPAVVNTIYLADTTSGGFNITLPSPSVAGVKIVVVDSSNNFNTNPVTLIPQVGGLINGSLSSLSLKNKITSIYFALPNKWTIEQQITARQSFTTDAPVIIAPNPTLSNSSYTTVGSLPTVMFSSYESFEIQLNTTYSAISPASNYILTLSLTLIDDSTSAMVHQVPVSISVLALSGTAVYSRPISYKFYTTPGTNYRFRVDAQITGGTPTTLTTADYDFNFTYSLVGK